MENSGAPGRLQAAPCHYNANDYTKQLQPLGLRQQRSDTVIFRAETLPGCPRDPGLRVHGADTHSPQERAREFLSGSVGRACALTPANRNPLLPLVAEPWARQEKMVNRFPLPACHFPVFPSSPSWQDLPRNQRMTVARPVPATALQSRHRRAGLGLSKTNVLKAIYRER